MTIKPLFPPAWPILNLDFANTKVLDPRITFTRSTIGSYVDATRIVRFAAVDEPRFNHDPETGESLGLMIEESRTNELEDSYLSGITEFNCEAENSTEVNPEGVASCKRIIVDAGTGSGGEGHRITQRFTNFFGDTTCSAFVKMDTHPYVLIGAGGQFTGYTAAFNINPAFTGDRLLGQDGKGTHTNIGAGYESYPNGWFRIWASGNTTGDDGWSLALSPDADTHRVTNWSAAGTEAIFAHGGQYEYAGFVTSYIPTSGSTATRADDVCGIEGTNFSSWYNQSEGTIVTEFNTPTDSMTNSSAATQMWDFSDGSTANRIYTTQSNSYQDSYKITAGGATSAQYNDSVWAGLLDVDVKSAMAYATDNVNWAYQGILQTADTNAVMPTGINEVNIGANLFDLHTFTGHISRLAYYPRRLSDEQLKALTT